MSRIRVFEKDDATGWQAVDDRSGAVGQGDTPEEAVAAMTLADMEPVLKAAFAVVEDMRAGRDRSDARAFNHLAVYDAVLDQRRARLEADDE